MKILQIFVSFFFFFFNSRSRSNFFYSNYFSQRSKNLKGIKEKDLRIYTAFTLEYLSRRYFSSQ